MIVAYDPFNEVKQFMSGGSIAAKFPKVGFEFEGTVLSFRVTQRTHINSGEPLYWEGRETVEESKLKFEASKSNPAKQLLLEVKSEPTGITWETNRYIEKAVPDDDGVRTMYINGNLQKAIAKALRDAGNADIEVGAYVKVVRGEDVKQPGSKYFSYTYTVQWTPAEGNTHAATDLVNEPTADGDPFAS